MWEAGKIEWASVQEQGCLCWSTMQGPRTPCCRNYTFQLMGVVVMVVAVMMVVVLVLMVEVMVRWRCHWWWRCWWW